MYTNGGHLFFQTANSYNISFKADGTGKINFNEIDLTGTLAQVSRCILNIDYFDLWFVISHKKLSTSINF